MSATGYAPTEHEAPGSWTPLRATIFVGGGSIFLWVLLVALARWLI